MARSGAVRLNEMAEARGFIKTELKYHKFICFITHPAQYLMSTGCKQLESEADFSVPSNTRI
jgi:hypothetical protein